MTAKTQSKGRIIAPTPALRDKHLTTCLTASAHAEICELAAMAETSASRIVRKALDKYLPEIRKSIGAGPRL
jgi:hypothetical protein